MPGFLAPSVYLPFESPVSKIDVGVWANIAEMGFKQSMMMNDMLDKSYQTVMATTPTLNQDREYVKNKLDNLNKQIDSFTGKGAFIAPKNMGAIRQIMRENAYDPELMAINQRTAKINEVYKRINEEHLPEDNYFNFKSSIDKANSDYAVSKAYNPNVSLNLNVTPYTNVADKLWGVVGKIPELKDARFNWTEDGNYMYVETLSGKDYNQTVGALMAALDPKDLEQMRAEYEGKLRKSPESLVTQDNIMKKDGTVYLPKGTVLSLAQFMEQEVLQIAAAAAGQSREISNVQKTMSAEAYLIRLREEAKNNGTTTESESIKDTTYLLETPAVGINQGKALSADIERMNGLERSIINLQTTINNGKEGNLDTSKQESELAFQKSELQILKTSVEASSKIITSAIPDGDLVNIWTGGQTALGRTADAMTGNRRYRVGGGISPIQIPTSSYQTNYTQLVEALDASFKDGSISEEGRDEILNSLPYKPTYDDNLSDARKYVSNLMSADLDAMESKLMSSSGYKEWDKSGYTRGSISGPLFGDAITDLFRTAKADKQYIEREHSAVRRKVEGNAREVGKANAITSDEKFFNAEGVPKPHPVFELNSTVTRDVITTPASFIDIYSNKTLDALITDKEVYSTDNLKAVVTDGFVGGKQIIQVTTKETKKTGDAAVKNPGQTYFVYAPANTYVEGTYNVLAQGNKEKAASFNNDRNFLVPLQKEEARLGILENKSSVQQAIDDDNSVAITWGQDGTNQPIKIKVYKVNDGNLMLAKQVGDGDVTFEKTKEDKYMSFKSLRDISQYIGGQMAIKGADKATKAANFKETTYAIGKVFPNINDNAKKSLLKSIGFETGGTYDPKQPNKQDGKAVGLIQFYPDDKGMYNFQYKNSKDEVIKLKYSKEQMVAMSHEEQAELMKMYFDAHGVDVNSFNSPAEVWLPIFMPLLYKYYKTPANRNKTIKEILDISKGPNVPSFTQVYRDNKALQPILTPTATIQDLVDYMNKKLQAH